MFILSQLWIYFKTICRIEVERICERWYWSGGGQPWRTVYVDNNATTKVAPEVWRRCCLTFWVLWKSLQHALFRRTGPEEGRWGKGQVADFLGAEPSEIVFTSCGTESDNAAILGTLDSYPEKRHLITLGWNTCCLGMSRPIWAEKATGSPNFLWSRGTVRSGWVKGILTDETALVTIMYANNETGVIFPIEEIGEIVKARGIPFHTDAVQAAGKIPLNMKKIESGYAFNLRA